MKALVVANVPMMDRNLDRSVRFRIRARYEGLRFQIPRILESSNKSKILKIYDFRTKPFVPACPPPDCNIPPVCAALSQALLLLAIAGLAFLNGIQTLQSKSLAVPNSSLNFNPIRFPVL